MVFYLFMWGCELLKAAPYLVLMTFDAVSYF